MGNKDQTPKAGTLSQELKVGKWMRVDSHTHKHVSSQVFHCRTNESLLWVFIQTLSFRSKNAPNSSNKTLTSRIQTGLQPKVTNGTKSSSFMPKQSRMVKRGKKSNSWKKSLAAILMPRNH